jgi:hypothetical protein
MHTSISKKLLAGVLSAVMVVSLFAGIPANNVNAAASAKMTGKTSVYTGSTYKYKVANVTKKQYVKVSVTGTAKTTVKYNKKVVKATKKIAGGKTITLYVKNTNSAGKKYTLTAKVYNKKTNKVVKTLKKTAKVYAKTTAVALDKTEATLKVGETVTLTATKTPAKNTKAITWKTSDAAVATVKAGVVTAVAEGTATITATSGAKKATATITVGAKEAELVDLKATGAKKLTATLSATAEVKAADLVVKKGAVTLTPADVTVEGKEVVITLGSKITEGTYSVTYAEKTLEVKTEDEKLVELKTVGSNLAVVKDDELTTNTGKDTDATTLNAEIEYQALNQYGEAMNAEITNVTSTFGGVTNFTEPTAKKNGVISVLNINAAVGIVGNTGKVIIVAKNGVSTTNDVTFSEEAKVAKIELVGIYDVAAADYVKEIPAEKSITNYKAIIRAYDQYNNEIKGTTKVTQKLVGQNINVAQVLTNVNVDATAGKLTASSFETVTIKDNDELAFVLTTPNANADLTKAGTFQIIVVGDRFGSVMNETIKVAQIKLIKSFSLEANETIYNNEENEVSFTAVDSEGNAVTDYKTLKKLVDIKTTEGTFKFQKNADGSAKLIYTPALVGKFTNADNAKENTVTSATATCNASISPADTLVATKTFTVYEDKAAESIVKYAGAVVSTTGTLAINPKKFVIEDQYGNTLAYNGDILIDYAYGDDVAEGVKVSTLTSLTVTSNPTKLYVSVADKSDNAGGHFDKTKAQLEINLVQGDSLKATNLRAEWYGDGDYLKVTAQAEKSGVDETMFLLTGTVNGKTVVIPAAQYSIKTDSYKPITEAEAETAVKEAQVTFTVVLKDAEKQEYTEEVTASYKYSAAKPQVTHIYRIETKENEQNQIVSTGKGSDSASGEVPNYDAKAFASVDFDKLFLVVDQYGDEITAANYVRTYEIELGKNTDAFKVVSNNTTKAEVTYTRANDQDATARVAVMYVTATLKNGMKATETVTINVPAISQQNP